MKAPKAVNFTALITTHATFTEGGHKTHLSTGDGAGALCRASKKDSQATEAYEIPDLEAWLLGGPREVCANCVSKARSLKAERRACQYKLPGWCNGEDVRAVIQRRVDHSHGWRNFYDGPTLYWCAGCRQVNHGCFKYADKKAKQKS